MLNVRIRSASMADSKRDVSFSMLAPLSVLRKQLVTYRDITTKYN